MHPIARRRAAKGWSQVAFAREVGVSANSVLGWEQGTKPRPMHIPRIAAALGIDAMELMKELEESRGQLEGKPSP